eukprot:TRINITY_DN453_c0_g3_i2.p1 TRINITY_DN453_c0_g3~~TRINITY_DN453_c0_g3_i2.p1  ORF type:complete len:202 (-),score=5.04 TRINITY_DN453_c0_g3_i2:75-680(-)
MNQTPFNPPEGQLLFQKVLPAGPWLRFNNQEHIQLVDIICNGQLFRTCTTKLSLLDDLGQEFIVNINLQRKEEQGNEQIMVFTVGSLIKDKKLQQGDRLLFFSSRMGQEDMRHNVANQIRIRVKRGTCCRTLFVIFRKYIRPLSRQDGKCVEVLDIYLNKAAILRSFKEILGNYHENNNWMQYNVNLQQYWTSFMFYELLG